MRAGAGLGREFRWLWAAYAVSAFGTRLAFDAFPLIAVLVLDVGPTEVSALAATGLAVGAAVAVPLGPWMEFRRKRPVMIATDLVRCAALLTVPTAYALDVLTFPQLLLVSVVVAAADLTFTTASGAFLKSLVPPEHLLAANSRFEATTWTTTMLGPPLGGAAIGLLGPVTTVVADAASYLISAAGIRAIGGRERHPIRNAPERSGPEPHDLKPYGTEPHDPKPYGPTPYGLKAHDLKPYDPKPHDPKPHDPKPHRPKPHDPKPHRPKPHDPKPHRPKPHGPMPDAPPGNGPRPGPPPRLRLGDLLDGWRYILTSPALRPLFLNAILVNGLIMATSPLLLILMVGQLGFSPWQYGLAFAVPCLGGLIGSRLSRRLVARHGQHRVLLAAGTLRACWPLGLAFVGPGPAGLVLVMAVELGLITCIGVFNPVMATRRLAETPPDRVARTLSAWSVTGKLTIAALTALWGLLGAFTTPRTAITIGGVLLLATPLLLPRHRQRPEPLREDDRTPRTLPKN